jgi:hypothetical protein
MPADTNISEIRSNVIIADSRGNCFAGSNSGVIIHSTDDGISWKHIDSGFPNISVQSLVSSGTFLFAGTMGKGIWSRSISEISEIRTDRVLSKSVQFQEPTIITPRRGNSSLIVLFTLMQTQSVECSVFNFSGCKIASLTDGVFLQGEHRVVWNPICYANGNYIVKTRIGTITSKKVITICR